MVMPLLASLPGLRPYLLSVRFCQRVSKPTHISIVIVFSAKLQRPASVCKQTQLDIHSTKKMTFNGILLENTLLCARSERHTSPPQWRVEVGDLLIEMPKSYCFKLSKHSGPKKMTHSNNKQGNVYALNIQLSTSEWPFFLWFLHLMDQLATLRRLWERMGTKKKNTAELKEVAAFSYADVTVGRSTGVCKWTLLSSLESHSKQ